MPETVSEQLARIRAERAAREAAEAAAAAAKEAQNRDASSPKKEKGFFDSFFNRGDAIDEAVEGTSDTQSRIKSIPSNLDPKLARQALQASVKGVPSNFDIKRLNQSTDSNN